MSTPWRNPPRPQEGFNTRWAGQLITHITRVFSDIFQGDFETKAKLILRGGFCHNVRLVTSAGDTLKLTDQVVDVSFAGAVAMTLPANPILGQTIKVQDSSGAAASNNITVAGDGVKALNGSVPGSFVLNANYQRAEFVYNGTQWIGA